MSKMSITDIINKKVIDKPRAFIYNLGKFVFSIPKLLFGGIKVKYHFDKKEMKGKQVILIGDHSSYTNPIYILFSYPFTRINIVIGYNRVFKKFLFFICEKLGFISKKNFYEDMVALNQMYKAIKRGCSLLLMPEGTMSYTGTTNPVVPGTIDLLKRFGVTVVMCKSHGFYAGRPVYRRHESFGHRELDYYVLFTPEELKEKSVEELEEKFNDIFKYDDIAWCKENKRHYFTFKPGMRRMPYFLFRCPKCGKDNTMIADKQKMICMECGNEIIIDEYHDTFKANENSVCPYSNTIDWYIDQRRTIKKEIEDPNFSIFYEAELFDFHTDKLYFKPLYKSGEGTVKIDKEGIHYKGTQNGNDVDLLFEIGSLHTFKFEYHHKNIFYYRNQFYCFVPKNKKLSNIKFMITIEELHAKVNSHWKKAFEDAYGKY